MIRLLSLLIQALWVAIALGEQVIVGPSGQRMIVGNDPFANDIAMLMGLMGRKSLSKSDIIVEMPSCAQVNDKKELEDIIKRDVGDKLAVTLVWFFNNSNSSVTTVAQEYNTMCEKYHNTKSNYNDEVYDLQVLAYDLIDTHQNDDRLKKMQTMKEFRLSGHVHDMEFVLFWGYLPVEENVKFTDSGDHHGHHLLNDAASVKVMFSKFQSWFKMFTHPVRTLANLADAVEFLQAENDGPTVILAKPPQKEVLVREKFYHQTPDVTYAEIDLEKFDASIDPNVLSMFSDLGLEGQWWASDPLVVIKNPHAFKSNHPLAYPNPTDGPTVEQRFFNKESDLLRLLSMNERDKAAFTDERKYDVYTKILKSLSLPLVLNTLDAEGVFEKRLPIYFVGIEGSEQVTPYFDEIARAAEMLRGRALFMIADGSPGVAGASVAQRLFHHLSIERDEVPVLKLLLMKDRGVGMWEKDALYCPGEDYMSSADSMVEFIDRFENKQLKVCVRSEPVHDEMVLPGEAEVLVGETFHEEVFEKDTDKDLLIDAYAPWCGHCKAFEPQLRKLAGLASHIPDNTLRITKIDATRNDLPGIGQLRGYPSILFFPGGNRSRPIEHRGSRSAEDLIKWIHERATNPFDLEKVLEKRMDAGNGSEILSRKAQIRAVLDEL